MTEEIIIDGVDVSECKYFNKVVNEEPYCNIDEEHLYTCSSDENCYYKQLIRLKQERDELKKACEKCKLFDIEKTNRDLLERIDKLEQGNKALKEKYSHVLKLAKTNADSNEYCLQELEKKNFAIEQESIQKSQTICELKQENETLTKENENRNDWITSLNKKCEELIKEKLKYRSALEEIREIAEKYKNMEGCRIPLGAIEMEINEVLNV